MPTILILLPSSLSLTYFVSFEARVLEAAQVRNTGGPCLLRERGAARVVGLRSGMPGWQRARREVYDAASCVGQSAILVGRADKLAVAPTCLNEARGESRGVLNGSTVGGALFHLAINWRSIKLHLREAAAQVSTSSRLRAFNFSASL